MTPTPKRNSGKRTPDGDHPWRTMPPKAEETTGTHRVIQIRYTLKGDTLVRFFNALGVENRQQAEAQFTEFTHSEGLDAKIVG